MTMPLDKISEIKPSPKIGLEVHAQLTNLRTKLFCNCSTNYRGKPPNSLVCPTCLGLPGSLPILNKKAIEHAVMVALATKSKVSHRMFFYRKNYFYPDLPKNFQITQYDKAGGVPLAKNGYLDIQEGRKERRIHISRIHLEEDPGRLIHKGSIDKSEYTLVDYNRCGIALLEIVTEPDMKSPKSARTFLQQIRSILEHLAVSDGNLEGAMRCDANISLTGGTRVEIKNISSFKEVERALTFEIIRQRKVLSQDVTVKRETRHWDEPRRITISLRTKEEEQDYRYFPEPNLVPINISKDFISKIKLKMPELPNERLKRFIFTYGLPHYDAKILVSSKSLADFYENCTKLHNKPKTISNWMMSDLLRYLNENNLELQESKLTPKKFVSMIKLIAKGEISGKIGKRILPMIILTGKTPQKLVREEGLNVITDSEMLNKIIDKVFNDNPKAVLDARIDEKAVHFLIGKIMKSTDGRPDPNLLYQIVKKRLEDYRD